MNLDLRQLLRLGRRWWWLLLLGPLLGGGLAYGAGTRQTPLYAATTTLFVNPIQSTGALDFNALQSSQSLIETYRVLIGTWPVLDPVVSQLQLPYPASELAEQVSVGTQADAQLIRVTVSDPDPARATTIADAVANSFVTYIGEKTAGLSDPSRAALDGQRTETRQQIDAVTRQIDTLERGADASDPTVQDELASLRTTLDQLEEADRQLQQTAQQMELAAAATQAQVTIATPAQVPAAPYAPRILVGTILGVVVGLLLAIGVVALCTYLDNTVTPETDFSALAGGPLLATVGTVPNLGAGRAQLIALSQPRASASEAIRLLRTNVEFAAAAHQLHVFAISSPAPSEGKSTITANLGVAMAQAGLSTVIVDADLRRPYQHRIFRVPNERGLTTLLTHPDQCWLAAAVDVAVPNLVLIPSGPTPPNPADLLSLARLPQLIQELRSAADVVLIDTPPLLAVSDPLAVATNVDGVILVCRAGRTRSDALRRAAAALDGCAVRTVGVVLNQLAGRRGQSYDYGGYYAAHSATEASLPVTLPVTRRVAPISNGRNGHRLEPVLPTRVDA